MHHKGGGLACNNGPPPCCKPLVVVLISPAPVRAAPAQPRPDVKGGQESAVVVVGSMGSRSWATWTLAHLLGGSSKQALNGPTPNPSHGENPGLNSALHALVMGGLKEEVAPSASPGSPEVRV